MMTPLCPPRTPWLCLFAICFLGFSACRSSRVATADEDLDAFYEQFMTDSAFQMNRIQFPLPGQKFTADVEDSTYQWLREEWQILSQPQVDPVHFSRDLLVTDTLATDEIAGKNSGFYFKMFYRPVKQRWHLVYMVDRDL